MGALGVATSTDGARVRRRYAGFGAHVPTRGVEPRRTPCVVRPEQAAGESCRGRFASWIQPLGPAPPAAPVPVVQRLRIRDFQSRDRGSNPRGDASTPRGSTDGRWFPKPEAVGSTPTGETDRSKASGLDLSDTQIFQVRSLASGPRGASELVNTPAPFWN